MTIVDLQPYPAVKTSGVPWLGGVPRHWEICRARYVFREVDLRTATGAEAHLSMSQRLGLVPSSEMEERRLVSESYIGAKLCEPGDLVLNRLKAHLGVFALASQAGLVSPDYTVLRQASASVSMRFFELLLKSSACRGELRTRAKGLVEGFWRLYTDDFYAIRLPMPPVSEQSAIVRFLDHAERHLRRYIRAKQKLIKLLEEQKQAVIHRAVTRGLDPNVRLKPSRVEWLGDVPVHWQVVRFKFVAAKIVDCLHETPKYSESGEFPAIRTADISPGIVHLSSARRIEAAEYARWVERLEPTPGDILYSREGERFGIAACVPEDTCLCISQRMMVFRVRPEHNPIFIMWLLNNRRVYAQACQDVMGATAPHVNVSTIRNYVMALPNRDEQDSLVAEIAARTSGFSSAITTMTRELSLFREYRTRLIADVVTGKLDVREAAATLPDEADEAEPFDDTAAVDPNEAVNDGDLDVAEEEDEA